MLLSLLSIMSSGSTATCQLYSSPNLARRRASSCSFIKLSPKASIHAPHRAPEILDIAGELRKVSGRILDAFVDLTFKFSNQPWLPTQSNFMPVDEIGDAVILDDIEGEIPDDFPEGVYIRNGSNPLFGGLQSASSVLGLSSETWVEGEGMLHAVSFSRATNGGGSGGGWIVSYKNRFVESDTFLLERRRNRPSFLPVVEGNPASVIASYLLNQLRYGKITKDMSSTNIFELSGRLFAVTESHLPQEMDLLTLETIGSWDVNGLWDRPFSAHPKKAPGGELVFVGADWKEPFLVLGIVSADGKELKHKVDLKLKRGIVCHDIGISERYNIILDMPLTFDFHRLIKGGPFIKYEKQSYARIGVMPRYGDSDSVKWFDVEPYCMFHIVNCYEIGDEVIVRGWRSIGSMIPGPDLGRNKSQWFSRGFNRKSTDEYSDGLFFSRLHEWRLNMNTASVTERYLMGTGFSSEFPFANDLFGGLYNKYAYAQVVNSEASSDAGLPKFGGLAKFYLDEKDATAFKLENLDSEYMKVERRKLGASEFYSGAAFVSKRGDFEEDDGWIISYVHNEQTNTSQVHIIDAKNFEGGLVAKITLPRRVPYGFHGAFIPVTNRL
ncbi:Carotenoid 9,10(9',10')-cleavage dioxygenase 1 [Platanthera zijinensis]|uniref:Carotenoid 9,10(9',10')-cleavage dioxygenase 1 n=1 Tax=Platanthera zijinensis TaxID=2320716 RepID=A0AAP0FZR1_9ASPA